MKPSAGGSIRILLVASMFADGALLIAHQRPDHLPALEQPLPYRPEAPEPDGPSTQHRPWVLGKVGVTSSLSTTSSIKSARWHFTTS